jgi:D-3-phosphoglycerate dehydrogenase
MDQDIYAGEYIPYLDVLEPIKALGHEFEVYPGVPVPSVEERYERIKDADVIVFGIYDIPNSVLARLDKLKAVVFFGVGYQSFIDGDYLARRGVPIYNTPNYGCNTVAEYAIGLAFSLCRKLFAADRRMRARDWRQDGLEGRELKGQTLGVVGTGAIGALVAEKASLLGAKVIASDVYESKRLVDDFDVRYVPMDELFATCDIVSLHLSMIPSTKGIITARLIDSMKKNSIFINTARAYIMEGEYKHVLARIKDGSLAAAAMDVFSDEPIPNYEDYDYENVLITPHIGYLTGNAMVNTLVIACEKILEFLGQ